MAAAAASSSDPLDDYYDLDDDDFGLGIGSTTEKSSLSNSKGSGLNIRNGNRDEFSSSNVAVLRQIWINERAAPELLAYEGELLEKVKEQIEYQQDQLMSEQKLSEREEFRHNLCQMQIDRVQFLRASYLRTRLKKVRRVCLCACVCVCVCVCAFDVCENACLLIETGLSP